MCVKMVCCVKCVGHRFLLWVTYHARKTSLSGMFQAPGGQIRELMIFLQIMFLKPYLVHKVVAYLLHFTNIRCII